ncbi:16S rRNA (guanine(527)-N(7))-methyltransferase RsmG [Aestuariivirga sp.]|uniref:16S rRNA (guanine(527)-N(7))-methyltransferase RsmG n=1 Tax=Aestuariivirga sp. TaxID=2650926 RepID=UPI0039E50497
MGMPDALVTRYNVSRESQAAIEAYALLLVKWQERINLIGPSTIDDIWSRHIEDALQIVPYLPPGNAPIADLGSGAGIPGLILAISTGRLVRLYESNGKKAAFLREAIRLAKAPAEVHQIRIEGIDHAPPTAVVIARAFAPLPLLLSLSEPFFQQKAIGLFHKGQDVDAELTEATKYWKLSFVKHPSVVDSKGVILEVTEAQRVDPK